MRVLKNQSSHTEAIISRYELLLIPAKLVLSGRRIIIKLAVGGKFASFAHNDRTGRLSAQNNAQNDGFHMRHANAVTPRNVFWRSYRSNTKNPQGAAFNPTTR